MLQIINNQTWHSNNFRIYNYVAVQHFLSQLPFSKVSSPKYTKSMDFSGASISFPNGSCNDVLYKKFDFSRFTNVESIEIGNECVQLVKAFNINGLNRLKTLRIGSNSFTIKNNKRRMGFKSKSFHILNCESLESIQIGEYSFSDFGGDFELKNLPQLQSIQIGATGYYAFDSYNFYHSSFVIRGIDMILNI